MDFQYKFKGNLQDFEIRMIFNRDLGFVTAFVKSQRPSIKIQRKSEGLRNQRGLQLIFEWDLKDFEIRRILNEDINEMLWIFEIWSSKS